VDQISRVGEVRTGELWIVPRLALLKLKCASYRAPELPVLLLGE
jgi:hypothetical protein